jgi:nicotinamide mononucleotide transporter
LRCRSLLAGDGFSRTLGAFNRLQAGSYKSAAPESNMSIWEITGTVLGIIGVALMIRQNIWGWPVGLVQVAVYAWVFFDARLYSDAILQVAFFLIQAYGWWHWWRGRTPAHELPVTRLGTAAMAGAIAAGVLLTGGWGWLMTRTDAALPYWDAFILIFSLIAQWLQARKKLENWPLWAVINTVAIGVYWVKDLHLTAGLYVVFWLMALWGWREWRRTMSRAV